MSPDQILPENNNDSSIDSDRKIFQSTIIVSSMTMLSRILGLIRDVVFARLFGASIVMDAFIVANRIPNMLRRFFAEGAFSQGFIPVMTKYHTSNDTFKEKEFIDSVAGTFGFFLFLLTLIGVFAAPFLVILVAPGFVDGDGRFDLATTMLRFTFPYLFFISMTAFAGGVLNSYGKFGASSFTPVILNVILILCALILAPRLEEPGMALAYGVFLSGVVQLIFQLPFLSKIRSIPIPRWNPLHKGVKRVYKLMLPALFGSSVAQINVLLSGMIASILGVGKISLLYYSDRLMELPLGIFGIAIATVTLPYLSKHSDSNSSVEFSRTIDWSMKLMLAISVPSAIALIVLARPLMATIFYGGAFSADDVDMAGLSLQAFSIGLIGFSLVKILAPAYFAREDTRTPVRIGIIALFVNIILSIFLTLILENSGFHASHAGLALAISIAAIVNALLLYRNLRNDEIIILSSDWFIFGCKIIFASIVMTGIVLYFDKPIEWWLNSDVLARSFRLSVIVILGVFTYFSVLVSLGIRISYFLKSPNDDLS